MVALGIALHDIAVYKVELFYSLAIMHVFVLKKQGGYNYSVSLGGCYCMHGFNSLSMFNYILYIVEYYLYNHTCMYYHQLPLYLYNYVCSVCNPCI